MYLEIDAFEKLQGSVKVKLITDIAYTHICFVFIGLNVFGSGITFSGQLLNAW